jgi:hypothetical protein
VSGDGDGDSDGKGGSRAGCHIFGAIGQSEVVFRAAAASGDGLHVREMGEHSGCVQFHPSYYSSYMQSGYRSMLV